ncbi:MAG TPA: universal stress protein [Thermoanaerobaculales bacterium]|nr:universal stress protein [Thermoanaerobaculales bacterium]HPA80563.1 universal stress protein [Thermoanaerobaculales bacterium]HQL30357.1 universal stress protein [Thermoanaerobaculales bacterium]HQN95225.1 universal stress protein [Thermoanaerobaculales bacterium]HQP44392.1 universal stress protein [Thermoanaerobaculales bacterium]
MAYRRIVAAVALQRYLDFTPISLRIRDLAALLAQASGASLTVLSVDAPVELLPGVETTADKLERFCEPLRAAGTEVAILMREGRPSRVIPEVVAELGADLLVVGTHSKRGPVDVGLGSTVSALDRDLAATVLLVRPTSAEQEAARELMIPRYPLVFPYG